MQKIASGQGLTKVTGVELVVGMLHGVSADFFAHSLEHAFRGSIFQGSEIVVRVVEPGECFNIYGSSEPQLANGWELMITKIQGCGD